jgi:hypothetical protein
MRTNAMAQAQLHAFISCNLDKQRMKTKGKTDYEVLGTLFTSAKSWLISAGVIMDKSS